MRLNTLTKVIFGCLLALPWTATASSPTHVTTNVPVDSYYYSYVDKLSGMGYISSLPTGAKPYSRMTMAKWAQEARTQAQLRPLPKYLASLLEALEQEFAPELATLNGQATYDKLRIHSASTTLAYNGADQASYSYGSSVRANWQPFGAGKNGHLYGQNGNLIADVEISGNIGHETALSLRPRFSYDLDQNGRAYLEEGYIKTRSGIWALEFGRQAMNWGQGTTGTFALSNSMNPLTTIQAHFNEPQKVSGFFRFLGEVDFHVFYGTLEGNRAAKAAEYNRKDYDNAGLLGARIDITPTSYFTLGLERISMMGGNGNGLCFTDWGHWLIGKNDNNEADRWNDIAGGDFRLRFPGMQIYGELYGEDQAGHLPSEHAYRLGFYLPQLTPDGAWDMTIEGARTNSAWYSHSKYQNGWTYHDGIMGDTMGKDAQKYFIQIQRHLPHEARLGFYAMRTAMNRSMINNPVVDEFGLTGQYKLRKNIYLDGTLGLARIKNASSIGATDTTKFALASVKWVY